MELLPAAYCEYIMRSKLNAAQLLDAEIERSDFYQKFTRKNES